MYYEIEKCRICKNHQLTSILDLGRQALTGVFPNSPEIKVPSGPVTLVKCHGDHKSNPHCGLVQLKQTYQPSMLYGSNYGYRSSLNTSMKNHLQSKASKILKFSNLQPGSLIIDIGSNDATTLNFFPKNYQLVGIDPCGEKFKEYYSSDITLIPDFFSYDKIHAVFPYKKAEIITSFSMFYDLDEPLQFAIDISRLLADDGIWVTEQSYLLSMLQQNSFDTICHEHLEYYSLSTILWICNKAGLKIIDIEFNGINGGSISLMIAKINSKFAECTDKIQKILLQEKQEELGELFPYLNFAHRVEEIKNKINHFFNKAKNDGLTVLGLGASTKGNVLLQFCEIDKNKIPSIGEVNEDKFGCYTPGTQIPIISEQELFKREFDYLLILPWHFKPWFESNPKYQKFSKKLLYPLPYFNF